MSEFKDWFDGLPFFTKYWLSLTVGISLLGRFGILAARHLILDLNSFVYNFHIWRPMSALFYYPITPGTGFHFLINCYFLYSYSLRLETGMFLGRPADYFTLLLFNWFCCVVVCLLANIPVLMDPMVMSVLYVWCQLNKDTVVSFWFGSRFKAMYLPWVLAGFNLIINGGGVLELLGILIGHLAFFLLFKYPQEFGGPALLTTPTFLRQLFPNTRHMGGFGSAPAAARAAPDGVPAGGRGVNWGRGHTLGGN